MRSHFYHPFERRGSADLLGFECLHFCLVFFLVWMRQTTTWIWKIKFVNTLLALKEKVWHTHLPFRVLIFEVWTPCSRGARSFGTDAKCGTVTLLFTQILAHTEFCWSAGKYLIKLQKLEINIIKLEKLRFQKLERWLHECKTGMNIPLPQADLYHCGSGEWTLRAQLLVRMSIKSIEPQNTPNH